MTKISSKELQDLLDDTSSIEAVNIKEKKQRKKERLNIYNKEIGSSNETKDKTIPK